MRLLPGVKNELPVKAKICNMVANNKYRERGLRKWLHLILLTGAVAIVTREKQRRRPRAVNAASEYWHNSEGVRRHTFDTAT